MDNNTIDINKTKEYINSLYDGLTFFDIYSGSFFVVLIWTLFDVYVYALCRILLVRQDIADDWINQRCNPKYMPFAGYINKPPDKTVSEYTLENFNYCVQNTTVNTTGIMVSPINNLLNAISSTYKNIGLSLQNMRGVLMNTRDNIANIAETIFEQIMNVVIEFTKILVALIDSINKTQGSLTAGLYTMFGSYNTLVSLAGIITTLILKMLATLAIVVIGLWATPFTFPAASAMTAVFLSISIPLAIIMATFSEMFNIKLGKIPKLKTCFDENVTFIMNDGTKKNIKNIVPGDYLEKGVKITSTFKVTSKGLNMYNLNGIIVSENHILKYCNKWIPVEEHPDAIRIEYNKPFLYCLNTTSKEIIVGNMIFTDWDEIYGDDLEKVINQIPGNIFAKSEKEKKENIHKYLEKGFKEDAIVKMQNNKTKLIKDLCIGDKLSTGGIVYGIVNINTLDKCSNTNTDINKCSDNLGIFYHILSTNGKIELDNKVIDDYNYIIDFITK